MRNVSKNFRQIETYNNGMIPSQVIYTYLLLPISFGKYMFHLFFRFLAMYIGLVSHKLRHALRPRIKTILGTADILFGGKFLRFMQRFKHKGHVTLGMRLID